MTSDSSGPYRPAGTLVVWVICLLGAVALLDIVAVWSTVLELQLFARIEAGGDVTEEEAIGNDLRQGIVGILQTATAVLLIVFFCMWVYRANYNARALGATGMAFTPGWSVGWYFIPIANLWKPFQAMREIYRASKPDPDEAGHGDAFLGVWWGLWIVTGFLGNAAFRLSIRAEGLQEITRSSQVTLASDVVDIPAAVLAYLVVSRTHNRQETKHLQQLT